MLNKKIPPVYCLKYINDSGYNSFYITNVTSYYKSRKFDEMLITIFNSKTGEVDLIFKKWFKKNNGVLMQEVFSWTSKCDDYWIVE